MNPNQIELGECILQNGLGGLGAITLLPIEFANPVPEFSLVSFGYPHQADCPDKISIGFSYNRKSQAFAFFKGLFMRRNPPLRHPVLIGMRGMVAK